MPRWKITSWILPTLRTVQLTYFWPSLNDDVAEYVRKCEVCRLAKASNEKTQAPMGMYRRALRADDIDRFHRKITGIKGQPTPICRSSHRLLLKNDLHSILYPSYGNFIGEIF